MKKMCFTAAPKSLCYILLCGLRASAGDFLPTARCGPLRPHSSAALPAWSHAVQNLSGQGVSGCEGCANDGERD